MHTDQYIRTFQGYTWRRKNLVKQARLNYFLVSSCTTDVIEGCDILPSYRSDHSIVEFELTLHKFEIGKLIWKLNTGLLKNPDYLNMINNIIDEEKLKYAIPIYNHDYIIKTDDELTFTIDDDTFLECLYLRIRGESIKFSSKLKTQNENLENKF